MSLGYANMGDLIGIIFFFGMFDSSFVNSLEVDTSNGLQQIHAICLAAFMIFQAKSGKKISQKAGSNLPCHTFGALH